MPKLATLALALALPACAQAQGEGLVKLVFSALAIGYVLFGVVVLLIIRRPRTKARVAIALVVVPTLPFLASGIASNLGGRYQRAVQAREAAEAVRYLEQACTTQRVVPSGTVTLHAADGLFVSPSPPLTLPEAPPLTPASPGDLLAANWFDAPLSETRHERQYVSALVWTTRLYPPALPPDHGFSFIEESEAGRLRAIASHAWWQAHGLARVSDARRPELQGALASNQEALFTWLLDDDHPQARYHLELADISSAEDRRHWVARGRARLLDTRDGQVLAQYVGLFANLDSNAVADYGDAWQRTLACPGTERAYSAEYGAWRGVDFFFDRFVRLD